MLTRLGFYQLEREVVVNYLKLSFGVLEDNRVDLLLDEHGSLGLSIYIMCLIAMCRSTPVDDHCSIEIDDMFVGRVARRLKADKIVVKNIIERIISMNLLRLYRVGTVRYFSKGFLRGTGELISNDFRRKRGDTDVANFKHRVNVNIIEKPLEPLGIVEEECLECGNEQN